MQSLNFEKFSHMIKRTLYAFLHLEVSNLSHLCSVMSIKNVHAKQFGFVQQTRHTSVCQLD
jgi:hypothetical protein